MKNWKTLLLGIAMIANTSFAAPQVVDKVAAVVNNGVVLESDVDGLMQSVKLNAGQAGQQLPDDATLRHQILERLIMDQILLQMGQKMGVKISDEQLDQAIANIAKQNNMTLDQMRSRLAQDGLSYSTYRSQIRKEMTISEVRNNEVRRRVTILPQEVDALALTTHIVDFQDVEADTRTNWANDIAFFRGAQRLGKDARQLLNTSPTHLAAFQRLLVSGIGDSQFAEIATVTRFINNRARLTFSRVNLFRSWVFR